MNSGCTGWDIDLKDKNSIQLNGLFNRITERDNQVRENTNDPIDGVFPIGY